MFDFEGLKHAVAAHGRVARVVIAAHDGSSPREVGAAMLVWAEGDGFGLSGTIGGGALEWEAVARARTMLPKGGSRLTREALGPKLGQCCGGAVTLLTEIYQDLPMAQAGVVARPAELGPSDTGFQGMPLAVKRLLDQARGQGVRPLPQLLQGWMVEPVARPERQIWIWGAGHVGRAMVAVLQPLPGVEITWIDTARARFPSEIAEGVNPLWTAQPEVFAALAPRDAEHLVMTYSHALDLELCHRLILQRFRWLGLIGSATKWARFRSRLAKLGHSDAEIRRITCPIGDIGLGKHPQAIALGVAVQLIKLQQQSETEITDDIREYGIAASGGAD